MITSMYRKKYQRNINHIVRDMNENIKNDWLWNGRFHIHQIRSSFHPFHDHSGAYFTAVLEIIDRKTGRKEINSFSNYSVAWEFYTWVNQCIVERFDVWSEIPSPRETAIAEGRHP